MLVVVVLVDELLPELPVGGGQTTGNGGHVTAGGEVGNVGV